MMRNLQLPCVSSRGVWLDVILPSVLDFGDRAEAHVWATHSDWYPRPLFDRYLGILSHQERVRASKFLREKDRDEYVIAHALLRTILARYLHCAPANIALSRSRRGKPMCRHNTGLTFNLTHRQGAILIAIATGYEVGVDVEQVRPIPDAWQLARRYFAPKEIEHLFSIEEAELNLAFFQLWTRKEAYLKSLGVGLSHSLDSFEVTFGPGVPFRLHGGAPGPWSLFHLEPFPGFVGALAVRGRALRLSGGLVRDVIPPAV